VFDALISAITPRTKLVVPVRENPTGVGFVPKERGLALSSPLAERGVARPSTRRKLSTLPQARVSITSNGLACRSKDPRIVVLRTFSRSTWLAGLRAAMQSPTRPRRPDGR